jgi:hypothetical protein
MSSLGVEQRPHANPTSSADIVCAFTVACRADRPALGAGRIPQLAFMRMGVHHAEAPAPQRLLW